MPYPSRLTGMQRMCAVLWDFVKLEEYTREWLFGAWIATSLGGLLIALLFRLMGEKPPDATLLPGIVGLALILVVLSVNIVWELGTYMVGLLMGPRRSEIARKAVKERWRKYREAQAAEERGR